MNERCRAFGWIGSRELGAQKMAVVISLSTGDISILKEQKERAKEKEIQVCVVPEMARL